MQDYRRLRIWQKAHRFALRVYGATAKFPASERFGLTNQLRRACVSIGSNLAEGCARGSDPDFRRYLNIAHGSASEAHYQLLLARDLGMLGNSDYVDLSGMLDEIRRMLWALSEKLKA